MTLDLSDNIPKIKILVNTFFIPVGSIRSMIQLNNGSIVATGGSNSPQRRVIIKI